MYKVENGVSYYAFEEIKLCLEQVKVFELKQKEAKNRKEKWMLLTRNRKTVEETVGLTLHLDIYIFSNNNLIFSSTVEQNN